MAHIFAECFWKNTCKDNAIKEDLTLYGIILIVSSMSVHVVFPFFVFKCCIFFSETSKLIYAPTTPLEYTKAML